MRVWERERAITELLGNADMLRLVMNIIRWMPVVTLRPDTHKHASLPLSNRVITHKHRLLHAWNDASETYKKHITHEGFAIWHQQLLFKEAVCFTSMSLLVQTELLCFSFGRQKTVSKLFKIIILSFLNETSTPHNSNGLFCPIFHMLNDHFCKLKAHLVLAMFMWNKCAIKTKNWKLVWKWQTIHVT